MTTYWVLLFVVFGLPTVLLTVMGCAVVVDKIRVSLGLEPFGDSRTYPELLRQAASKTENSAPEGSPSAEALAA